MEEAFDIAYDNVTLLLGEQRKLNEVYLADVEEVIVNEPDDRYLTDEEKKIVIEFYINGRTEREMSGILGIPKTSFRRRESRLRKKLGILLKDFL